MFRHMANISTAFQLIAHWFSNQILSGFEKEFKKNKHSEFLQSLYK